MTRRHGFGARVRPPPLHYLAGGRAPCGRWKGRRVWEQAPFPDLPSVRKRAGQIKSSSDSVTRPRQNKERRDPSENHSIQH